MTIVKLTNRSRRAGSSKRNRGRRSSPVPSPREGGRWSGSMSVRALTRVDLPWSTWPAVPITNVVGIRERR